MLTKGTNFMKVSIKYFATSIKWVGKSKPPPPDSIVISIT